MFSRCIFELQLKDTQKVNVKSFSQQCILLWENVNSPKSLRKSFLSKSSNRSSVRINTSLNCRVYNPFTCIRTISNQESSSETDKKFDNCCPCNSDTACSTTFGIYQWKARDGSDTCHLRYLCAEVVKAMYCEEQDRCKLCLCQPRYSVA